MKRSLAAALATLLFMATPCLADLTSNVTLDWSTFKVTTMSLTGGAAPVFNWAGQETDTFAEADTNGGSYESMYDLSADWDNPIPTESVATTEKAQSFARRQYVDSSNWTLTASATSSQDTTNAGAFNYGYASVNNWGAFDVIGEGLLVFEVDWQMTLPGALGDLANSTVGDVAMGATLLGENGESFSDIHRELFSDEQVAEAFSGKLVVTLYNTDAAASGEFWAWASADSQSQNVPEPSSFLLMLGGLGFFGWAARRKAKTRS